MKWKDLTIEDKLDVLRENIKVCRFMIYTLATLVGVVLTIW